MADLNLGPTGGTNPDATQRGIIRGKLAAAHSAIQTPVEILPSAILFHDDCSGVAQTLAASGTRVVEPGPGTMTASSVPGSSLVRYENGELILANINSTSTPCVRDASRTATAGQAVVVRLIPSFEPGGGQRNCFVGFSTSASSGGMGGGEINIYQATGASYPTIQISNLSVAGDTGTMNVGLGLFKAGQEIALCVHYKTTSHQEYFMQGGELASWGATVGSDEWMKIGDSFADISAVTVYPGVVNQFLGETRIRDFKVYSSWKPSNRHQFFDYNKVYGGTHIPTLATDPVSGLTICAWNKGTTHTSADVELRYATRLADGSWAAEATLLAAYGGATGQQIQNISTINGALWLIYYRHATALDGGTLYRRTISVNATTGAITLGSEVLLGITGTRNLAFSQALTLPSGRIMLLHHFGDTSAAQASYSDDNGITWTTNAIGQTGIEATGVIESDGAIGVMLRTSSNVAYYTRCADPQAAPQTWSARIAIDSIPQPGASGARMQYCKLSNGEILLIGNDHKTTRRNVTVWRMGDGGIVYGKTRIGDWNEENGTAILQYPTLIEDGEDILIALSRLPSAVATSGIGIQVDAIRWTQPISVHAGGTGKKERLPHVPARRRYNATILTYGTAPVPDQCYGDNFYITLTASTAVIGAPINGTPWQPIRISFVQGGSGSYTATFNAIFEFGNITPTWLTAVGATNTLEAYLNPLTGKYVVTRFV